MKSNKSLLKRIKITKTGKIMKRPLNQGHFNAKESGNDTRSKRKEKNVSSVERKIIKQVI